MRNNPNTQAIEPVPDNRVSMGLGPHNTLGATNIFTSTSATNTSNISPFK
jgi:hypothetical protein